MKFITKFTLFLTIVFFFNCSSEKEQSLIINGEVVDPITKSILLVKPGQFLDSDSLIEIPVTDGKFHYATKLDFPEAVELFLGQAKNVGGRPMPLFLENTTINLTIHPENEFDKNIIDGGNINLEYQKYSNDIKSKFGNKIEVIYDSISNMRKANGYYTEAMNTIQSKINEAKSHDEKLPLWEERKSLVANKLHLTSKGLILDKKLADINKKQDEFKQNYINQNPNIISYFLFINDLVYREESIDINLGKNNLQKLSKANPNHPYNKLASDLLEAIDNITVGKKYINFSAPDLNGNKVKLSDKIDGKIALLDLWATWCGPCLAKSRTMIPLYDEFNDKGFTIVGVAGELKNTDRLVKFLEKEKWPWLNLVELDKQNNIWQKYNVDGGGGGIFLIDNNGLILSIDPTADEVRKELESRLN